MQTIIAAIFNKSAPTVREDHADFITKPHNRHSQQQKNEMELSEKYSTISCNGIVSPNSMHSSNHLKMKHTPRKPSFNDTGDDDDYDDAINLTSAPKKALFRNKSRRIIDSEEELESKQFTEYDNFLYLNNNSPFKRGNDASIEVNAEYGSELYEDDAPINEPFTSNKTHKYDKHNDRRLSINSDQQTHTQYDKKSQSSSGPKPRGRPRKITHPYDTEFHTIPSITISQPKRKVSTSNQAANARKESRVTDTSDNKPLEERPVYETFPDLDLDYEILVLYHESNTSVQDIESLEIDKTTGKKNTYFKGIKPMKSFPVIPKNIMKPIPKQCYRKITHYDDAEFVDTRSDAYIHHVEQTDVELNHRTEYDMDSQDKFWLQEMNNQRKKDCIGDVPDIVFESIMDRLEKEWFELTKELIKHRKEDYFDYPEDINCAICDDGECENSNAILFCDGCNLAVHQDCYGVPFIPEGQWLCRKCMVSPDHPVTCLLCPNKDGAFKQTPEGKWAHSMCALWIPEVSVANPVYMEPVDHIDQIPKSRWKLNCFICEKKVGACIQCQHKNCFTAFHVTCARAVKLEMNIKITGDNVLMGASCDKHSTAVEGIDIATNISHFKSQLQLNKGGRKSGIQALVSPHKKRRKQKTLISPLIPQYIYTKVVDHLKGNQALKKKGPFVTEVCKYWSLKREQRRGAPLLKRLHLEPWTALAPPSAEELQQRKAKYESLVKFHAYMNKIMSLMEFVKRREKKILASVKLMQEYIIEYTYPLHKLLKGALQEIRGADKKGIFETPVDTSIVRDYLQYIKEPMSFSTIREKLEGFNYIDIESFQHDVDLVYRNAMIYNAPPTIFYKTAQKVEKQVKMSLQTVRTRYEALDIDAKTGFVNHLFDGMILEYCPFEEGENEYTNQKYILELQKEIRILERLSREDASARFQNKNQCEETKKLNPIPKRKLSLKLNLNPNKKIKLYQTNNAQINRSSREISPLVYDADTSMNHMECITPLNDIRTPKQKKIHCKKRTKLGKLAALESTSIPITPCVNIPLKNMPMSKKVDTKKWYYVDKDEYDEKQAVQEDKIILKIKRRLTNIPSSTTASFSRKSDTSSSIEKKRSRNISSNTPLKSSRKLDTLTSEKKHLISPSASTTIKTLSVDSKKLKAQGPGQFDSSILLEGTWMKLGVCWFKNIVSGQVVRVKLNEMPDSFKPLPRDNKWLKMNSPAKGDVHAVTKDEIENDDHEKKDLLFGNKKELSTEEAKNSNAWKDLGTGWYRHIESGKTVRAKKNTEGTILPNLDYVVASGDESQAFAFENYVFKKDVREKGGKDTDGVDSESLNPLKRGRNLNEVNTAFKLRVPQFTPHPFDESEDVLSLVKLLGRNGSHCSD